MTTDSTLSHRPAQAAYADAVRSAARSIAGDYEAGACLSTVGLYSDAAERWRAAARDDGAEGEAARVGLAALDGLNPSARDTPFEIATELLATISRSDGVGQQVRALNDRFMAAARAAPTRSSPVPRSAGELWIVWARFRRAGPMEPALDWLRRVADRVEDGIRPHVVASLAESRIAQGAIDEAIGATDAIDGAPWKRSIEDRVLREMELSDRTGAWESVDALERMIATGEATERLETAHSALRSGDWRGAASGFDHLADELQDAEARYRLLILAGRALELGEKYDAAETRYRLAWELDTAKYPAWSHLVRLYAGASDWEQLSDFVRRDGRAPIKERDRALLADALDALSARSLDTVLSIGVALLRSGGSDSAEKTLAKLAELPGTREEIETLVQALESVEDSLQQGDPLSVPLRQTMRELRTKEPLVDDATQAAPDEAHDALPGTVSERSASEDPFSPDQPFDARVATAEAMELSDDALDRLTDSARSDRELLRVVRRLVGWAERREPPDDIRLLDRAARLLGSRLGRHDDAMAVHEAILSRDDRHVPSHLALAQAARDRDAWDKVVDHLERAARQLREADARAQLYSEIGSIYETRLRRANLALENYLVSFVCDSGQRETFDRLERLYLDQKRFKDLLGGYEIAIDYAKRHPDKSGLDAADLLIRRARVQIRELDDASGAASSLVQALEVRPADRRAVEILCRVVGSRAPRELVQRGLSLFMEAASADDRRAAQSSPLIARFLTGI